MFQSLRSIFNSWMGEWVDFDEAIEIHVEDIDWLVEAWNENVFSMDYKLVCAEQLLWAKVKK